MSSALNFLTKFVNSPGGVLTAGAALAGIVWKFFERVEAVLTDQTKFEIAVWLVGVKVGQTVEPWPETFAKVLDRVFGHKLLSLTSIIRSGIMTCLFSGVLPSVLVVVDFGTAHYKFGLGYALFVSVFPIVAGNLLPDFVSVTVVRKILLLYRRTASRLIRVLIVLFPLITSFMLAVTGAECSLLILIATTFVPGQEALSELIATLAFASLGSVCSAFIVAIWLWLYAGSGFILKAARHFDLGFNWFNRKFDVEKKPLQSIGLVAGVFVAVIYWTAVGISWLL